MEKKTRKIRKSALIVMIVLAVAAAVCAGYFIAQAFHQQNEQDADSTASASSQSTASALDSLKISASSYQVYRVDRLDFAYVIASIHVEGDQAASIDLSHFVTSEGISLDAVSSYRSQIEAQSISLTDIVSVLDHTGSEADMNILIPVKEKNAESIKVNCDFGTDNTLSFDLSVNTEVPSSSASAAAETTSAAESTADASQLSVSESFEITGDELLDNGESYSLPSTARIFVFKVTNPSGGSFASAQFDAGSNGIYYAESASVSTSKYDNILNSTTAAQGSGYLFFIVLDPEHTFSASGTLTVYDSGNGNTAYTRSIG